MSAQQKPVSTVQGLIAWAMQTRPARVMAHYTSRGGPVLAGGMSYSSLFAAFAGVWTLFSVIGLFIARSETVWDALVDYLAKSVPGLIDTGEGGAISPETLQGVPSTLSWTGAVALVSLIFTLFGWLGAVRTGVRAQFGRSPLPQQPVVAQLRDLGLLVGFGLLVIISALASTVSSGLGRRISALLGFGEQSMLSWLLVTIGSLLLSLVLDAIILIVIMRVLAQVIIPVRRMLPVVIWGAVATTLLKAVGGSLIGGGSNPLLAGFLTIVGLLLWFSLLSQTVLIAAAWLAVVASDHEVNERHDGDLDFWGASRLQDAVRGPHAVDSPLPVEVPDSAIKTDEPDTEAR
ncbi:YihY/virulence factor BrkB family protein [Pseudoclavibacter sp. CFCC 13611]|uniref:YihY/virulence factor BrkB family protein n=1 Tax=Pseudoclavibacter sp. CFCC 13611 TaxID=2615178 RepID=UPI0013013F6A|nr:YihY/virulence factor BrkB family protein [Pseudoclavibacter sp. CFCC 13611]KAB1663165.1 YihY/virulence factor BrkB family protein [Pseudoclavibacter sp. CFCC 13611]